MVICKFQQWSVLRSTLYNVLINNLEADVNTEIKSLEDTKLFRIERRREDGKEALIELNDQAIKWQLKFRVNKCEVIHIVKTTLESRKTEPAVPTQEQDSEVMILSFIKH